MTAWQSIVSFPHAIRLWRHRPPNIDIFNEAWTRSQQIPRQFDLTESRLHDRLWCELLWTYTDWGGFSEAQSFSPFKDFTSETVLLSGSSAFFLPGYGDFTPEWWQKWTVCCQCVWWTETLSHCTFFSLIHLCSCLMLWTDTIMQRINT